VGREIGIRFSAFAAACYTHSQTREKKKLAARMIIIEPIRNIPRSLTPMRARKKAEIETLDGDLTK
jgi:hypothetical protein